VGDGEGRVVLQETDVSVGSLSEEAVVKPDFLLCSLQN
jgi:hypothetical protein